jgi:hypothetical protein
MADEEPLIDRLEPLIDRLAKVLAEIVDAPLVTVRDIGTNQQLPLQVGSFRPDLSERACELLEEAGHG